MVLESLVNPIKAERQPYEMFFIGLLYASIAIFLSIWIFKEYSSLVMVFLTVFAAVPLMYNTLKLEEKKDIEISGERKLLREHGKALKFFSAFANNPEVPNSKPCKCINTSSLSELHLSITFQITFNGSKRDNFKNGSLFFEYPKASQIPW